MSPVTGLADGTNFFFCSNSYGKFQPGYRAEISAVTEMNKARPFKFYPGILAGVFIWENFQREISVAKTEISVTGLARLLK